MNLAAPSETVASLSLPAVSADSSQASESSLLPSVVHVEQVTVNDPPKAFLEMSLTRDHWQVMTKQFYPNAKSLATVMLVARYCNARGLDPMLKPLHIVPVYNSKTGCHEDSIWPGIALYEITAHRTKEFAGKDPCELGELKKFTFKGDPDKQGKSSTIEFEAPAWAKCTVYRLVQGQKQSFTSEAIPFQEAVALTQGLPNSQWRKRPQGMLTKSAFAAALRVAFPEECGSEPTAEEMEGRTINEASTLTAAAVRERTEANAAPAVQEAAQPTEAIHEAEELADVPAEFQHLVTGVEPTVLDGLKDLETLKESMIGSLVAAAAIASEAGQTERVEELQEVLVELQKATRQQALGLDKFAKARGWTTNQLGAHLEQTYQIPMKAWTTSLTVDQIAETEIFLEANKK